MATCPMMHETVWLNQRQYEQAETYYQELLVQRKYGSCDKTTSSSPLVSEIAKARQQIKSTLSTQTGTAAVLSAEQANRIEKLEKENKELKKALEDMQTCMKKLDARVTTLEKSAPKPANGPKGDKQEEKKDASKDDDDDDEDFELFGSDEDSGDEDLLSRPTEKTQKTKKDGPVAKSIIVLDVKPWDDETDLVAMEKCVRSIETDGLLWGGSKFVDVAYGIKKLQINCVVEDEKVGTDFLEETISEFEDYVQSVDIAAFNKI